MFGFDDDEKPAPKDPSPDAMDVDDDSDDNDEMPETMENLRKAAMAPPPGTSFGGSPADGTYGFNLFYEDTPSPSHMDSDNNVNMEEGTSQHSNRRSKSMH